MASVTITPRPPAFSSPHGRDVPVTALSLLLMLFLASLITAASSPYLISGAGPLPRRNFFLLPCPPSRHCWRSADVVIILVRPPLAMGVSAASAPRRARRPVVLCRTPCGCIAFVSRALSAIHTLFAQEQYLVCY
jgi:hypothetical protein